MPVKTTPIPPRMVHDQAVRELAEISRHSSAETPVELTIGAEAIDAIKDILQGVSNGDLRFITTRSRWLSRGMLHALSDPRNTVSPASHLGSRKKASDV